MIQPRRRKGRRSQMTPSASKPPLRTVMRSGGLLCPFLPCASCSYLRRAAAGRSFPPARLTGAGWAQALISYRLSAGLYRPGGKRVFYFPLPAGHRGFLQPSSRQGRPLVTGSSAGTGVSAANASACSALARSAQRSTRLWELSSCIRVRAVSALTSAYIRHSAS